MRLRTKILLGFLFPALMLLVAGAWSIYELNSVGASVQKLLDDNYRSINAGRTMLEALEQQDSAVLWLLLGNWDRGRALLTPADSLFETGFQAALHNLTVPGEKNCLDSVRIHYDAYKSLWIRPIVGTQKERNLDWYFAEVHAQFQRTKVAINHLIGLNDQVMYQTASELKEKSKRTIMPGVVAILSALVFTFIFSYFVNYYMLNPIFRIIKGIQAFLESQRPFNVEVETRDEFVELTSAIRTLCEHANYIPEDRL